MHAELDLREGMNYRRDSNRLPRHGGVGVAASRLVLFSDENSANPLRSEVRRGRSRMPAIRTRCLV